MLEDNKTQMQKEKYIWPFLQKKRPIFEVNTSFVKNERNRSASASQHRVERLSKHQVRGEWAVCLIYMLCRQQRRILRSPTMQIVIARSTSSTRQASGAALCVKNTLIEIRYLASTISTRWHTSTDQI